MATAAVALSLVLGGCGGSSKTPEPPPPPPPEPPAPMPVDVSGEITLIKEQHDALLGVLGDNGDSVTLDAGADGVTRAGVTFTCMSAYPCTVTVENSAGTIVAMWKSQTLGAGTASAMAAGLEPPVDTFAELNAGSTASIRRDVVGVANNANTADPAFTLTELIGMGIGGPGVLNADMAGLRSNFQANGAALTGHATDADNDADTAAIADPGDPPDLRKGTTISGAMRPDGDGIPIGGDRDSESPPNMANAVKPLEDAGWAVKTLHRDWGDTAGDGDGGFETGAIVVENLGEGTPYPFDRKLYTKYVNDAAQDMFRLVVRADGSAPGVTTLGTSVNIGPAVDITVGTDTVNISAATATQWAAMVFDSDSLVPAQSQDPSVNEDETFTGTYFGAPGRFQCIAPQPDTGFGCGLARNADGAVMVIDTNSATTGIQGGGRWTFTPDPDAMITVPDQDWVAYGAWLTTPDAAAGDHRLGVFFNGMDPWAPAANSLSAGDAAGLRGSATYSGGATGVYVDGTRSGLFTARAMLTAKFDVDSDANADTGDYTISGRIDNFRGTDGVYLGDDTQASPNDPTAGENDWVVELGSDALNATDTAAGLVNGGTTGSADGVSWTGLWNGQLFGPSTNADGDALAPSGVAGRFWAETDDPDDAADAVDADRPVTAVVGAFGATKD